MQRHRGIDVLIGFSGMWTLLFGIVAMFGFGFGSDVYGWLIVATFFTGGIYAFFLGISLVRGSPSLGGSVGVPRP